MEIHSNVRLLMEVNHVKISDLVEKNGMDEITIIKARNHDLIGTCRLSSLYKIAEVLGVKIDNLFCIKKIKEKNDFSKQNS